MRKLSQKVKRVEPIIKMKRDRLNQEAAALAAIRSEKVAIVASIKESQKRYLEGYDELNRLRMSPARTNLATHEAALDAVREQWRSLMLKVEEAERREKAQITHLLTAERDLRVIEKLQDNYQGAIDDSLRRNEQKLLDEHALRRHIGRNDDR